MAVVADLRSRLFHLLHHTGVYLDYALHAYRPLYTCGPSIRLDCDYTEARHPSDEVYPSMRSHCLSCAESRVVCGLYCGIRRESGSALHGAVYLCLTCCSDKVFSYWLSLYQSTARLWVTQRSMS